MSQPSDLDMVEEMFEEICRHLPFEVVLETLRTRYDVGLLEELRIALQNSGCCSKLDIPGAF